LSSQASRQNAIKKTQVQYSSVETLQTKYCILQYHYLGIHFANNLGKLCFFTRNRSSVFVGRCISNLKFKGVFKDGLVIGQDWGVYWTNIQMAHPGFQFKG